MCLLGYHQMILYDAGQRRLLRCNRIVFSDQWFNDFRHKSFDRLALKDALTNHGTGNIE